ncbi:FIST N-terminal domain-containing protein [Luteitalea sp.]|uniref:FIST signal transduction protein n=1 Tax=Luteitalea sp. TaxID=2004800 RepID=UPI0025C0A274|nr:FIST N-terminal domain-containing protein [Luteitalea sp.]
MKTQQRHWTLEHGWRPADAGPVALCAQLVLVFGAPDRLRDPRRLAELAAAYPEAHVVGCSTAGEILGTAVLDDSLVATAIEFDSTAIRVADTPIDGDGDSCDAGRRLALALPHEDLAHVLVLSDGISVNGSQLVEGLTSRLPTGVTATGGLAGDGARFVETLVLHDRQPRTRVAVAVGFYGSHVRVGYASLGGWDPFGPERLITKAVGNVLFELDGQSALGLYKRYLGDYAANLPASGLHFPLRVRVADDRPPTVRTILGIDEAGQSMTFAGDMPVGARAQLMRANIDRLIDGAMGAARASHRVGAPTPALALLISCVGRKLVLKQRIEEEVEAVREVLGPGATLAGFYSYGEISPFTQSAHCELHNQTMTITTFSEL